MFKYLFRAEYKNGKVIHQKQNDISEKDPAKSAFYDVLNENTEENPLVYFSLVDEKNEWIASVDLETGSFCIGGRKINIHNSEDFYTNKRLIYFRRNTILFNVGLEERGKNVVYKMGWQANDKNGNNVQFVIELD